MLVKTIDNSYILKSIGREKKIYWNLDGSAYFKWNGRRYRLDEIPRLTYPVMYTDAAGKVGYASGYITICNCYGVLVELTDYESIILWEEEEA